MNRYKDRLMSARLETFGIDEASLYYAEIKATATGKSTDKGKKYFMIRYPKYIRAATEKLVRVREDIKTAETGI